ncbi:MAG: hypothetical protein WAM42_20300, partial [Candidatus Nitrosopolaris sp.]
MARGNSTGISDSYYRATEQQLLEDYLKAVDMLNINDDKLTLQKQVAVLNEVKSINSSNTNKTPTCQTHFI